MSNKKTSILFVSHDASLTGAPILLLNLMKVLAASGLYKFQVVLGRGGYLEEEFRKMAPATILKPKNYGKRNRAFLNGMDFLFFKARVFFFG
jgi:hypothetical protein